MDDSGRHHNKEIQGDRGKMIAPLRFCQDRSDRTGPEAAFRRGTATRRQRDPQDLTQARFPA
jgi:hypothetical protein